MAVSVRKRFRNIVVSENIPVQKDFCSIEEVLEYSCKRLHRSH